MTILTQSSLSFVLGIPISSNVDGPFPIVFPSGWSVATLAGLATGGTGALAALGAGLCVPGPCEDGGGVGLAPVGYCIGGALERPPSVRVTPWGPAMGPGPGPGLGCGWLDWRGG